MVYNVGIIWHILEFIIKYIVFLASTWLEDDYFSKKNKLMQFFNELNRNFISNFTSKTIQ